MNLCSPKVVRELMEKYGLSPKKGYGQNFLINAAIPERIAASAALGEDAGYSGFCDTVEGVCALEIGPGMGAMTKELSAMFEKVLAVEIDTGLIPLLGETLEECENVTVFNEDFMKLSLGRFLDENAPEMPVRVCANLPYYITTPVLMKILEEFPLTGKSRIESVTVMVQSEVADRICAEAGNSDVGALSISVALHGRAERLFTVSAGNFLPAPKVASAVAQITLHENGIYDVYPDAPKDTAECLKFSEKVKKLVSLAFLQRRKTLINALSSEVSKDRLLQALEKLGIRSDIRGEKLSAKDFCAIADEIYYK